MKNLLTTSTSRRTYTRLCTMVVLLPPANAAIAEAESWFVGEDPAQLSIGRLPDGSEVLLIPRADESTRAFERRWRRANQALTQLWRQHRRSMSKAADHYLGESYASQGV